MQILYREHSRSGYFGVNRMQKWASSSLGVGRGQKFPLYWIRIKREQRQILKLAILLAYLTKTFSAFFRATQTFLEPFLMFGSQWWGRSACGREGAAGVVGNNGMRVGCGWKGRLKNGFSGPKLFVPRINKVEKGLVGCCVTSMTLSWGKFKVRVQRGIFKSFTVSAFLRDWNDQLCIECGWKYLKAEDTTNPLSERVTTASWTISERWVCVINHNQLWNC